MTSQDWYEEFEYEYTSVQCPHEKTIRLADTNWKFAFRGQKEKSVTVNAGPFSATSYNTQYRLYCGKCGKHRWFVQTNSIMDHKGLFHLRLRYLLIGGVSLMILFILSGNLLAWLFL